MWMSVAVSLAGQLLPYPREIVPVCVISMYRGRKAQGGRGAGSN